MTLNEFIVYARKNGPSLSVYRSHVDEPGWAALYVRWTRRLLAGAVVFPVLDLAKGEAEHPGQGSFGKLVERVRQDHPDVTLFVELVQTTRFKEHLRRTGWTGTGPGGDESFYLLASNPTR